MKGLIRKRSASTAARLQRALSAKALRSPSTERAMPIQVSAPVPINTDTQTPPEPKRQFIMESAVHITMVSLLRSFKKNSPPHWLKLRRFLYNYPKVKYYIAIDRYICRIHELRIFK